MASMVTETVEMAATGLTMALQAMASGGKMRDGTLGKVAVGEKGRAHWARNRE